MSTLGQILDNLGCTAELDEGDLVSSAVVLLSVMVADDNRPRLVIANSEGIGWIEQAGLVSVAHSICSEPPIEGDD